ncbi:MAG: glycosyltransferase family 2 protein [Cyanobacteria bacterium P01_D01_bin.44]
MISIITPVFNGEKFIEACIKSVINQNYFHVEHIIIDGASTDKTVEIIEQYFKKYNHIKFISKKDNGQSDAINTGISLATGEIIGILNVDDSYEPNTLLRVSDIFRHLSEPSFVTGNCNIYDSSGYLRKVNKPKKMDIIDLLLKSKSHPFPANPSAYFYHKSLHQKIGLYDVNDHYTMDLDFICRAVQGATVKYVDEVWGNFLLHEGSKTFNDSIVAHRGRNRREKVLNLYRNSLSLSKKCKLTVFDSFYSASLHSRRLPGKFRNFLSKLNYKSNNFHN